jgi:PKD repeat protein
VKVSACETMKISKLAFLICCTWLFCALQIDAQTARIFCNGSIRSTDTTIIVCRGTSITFIDSSLASAGPNWRFQGGAPSTSISPSQAVTFNANGIDSVVLIASGAIPDTTHIFVNVVSPAAGFTFTPNNACAGTTIDFTNTSSGNGPQSYNWTFGSISGAPGISSSEDPSVSFNPAFGSGTINYNVRLISTDADGCRDTIINTVNVLKRPDSQIDTAGNIDFDMAQDIFINCLATRTTPNFTLSLTNSSTTAASNTSYSINWGDGVVTLLAGSFTTTSHLYTSLGFFTISVTTVNGSCSSTRSYRFFNGNTPLGNLFTIANTTDCNPATLTWPVDTANTNQNPPGTTYEFSVNDGSASQVYTQANLPTTISHIFSTTSCGVPGGTNAFTVNFNVTNPCALNPTSPGVVRISQTPNAIFTISPDTVICQGSIVTFTNASIGNYFNGSLCQTTFTKEWSITSATGWVVTSGILIPISPATGSNTLSVRFDSSGTYTIKLLVVRPGSTISRCTADSITRIICVQPQLLPSFTYTSSPSSRCAPATLSFTNTSNTLTSCGNTTYTWSFPNGTGPVFTSGTNTNSINPVVLFSTAGSYVIRLSITNSCGTIIRDSTIVIKGPPSVSIPANRIYCDSQTIAFNNTNGNHNPLFNANGGTLSYQWSITPAGAIFASGTIDTSANPVIHFPANSSIDIVYMVKVIVTNECGSHNDSQQITIHPGVLAPTVRDTSRCGSGNMTLSAIIGTNGTGVRWYTDSLGGSLLSSSIPFTPTVSNTITYYVSSFNSTTSCESRRAPLRVTINPIPSLPAMRDTSRCGPSSVALTGIPGTNGNKLRWYPASSGGSFFHEGNTYITPLLDTTTSYFVSTIDSVTGCESAGRQMITVAIHSLPLVFAGNDTTFCNLNTNITLVNYSPPLAGSGGTGVWSGSVVTAGGVFNPINAGVSTNTLIYTFTNTTTGCVNRDSMIVSVIDPTTPNAGNDTAVCKNSGSITLTGMPVGGGWTVGGSPLPGGIFNPANAGVFMLVYSIGSGSCLSRDSMIITVHDLPAPNFALASGICPNQSVALTATNSNGTTAANYKWRVRNFKSFSNTIISDSTVQSPVLNFPENQTSDTVGYNIKLIIETNDGCIDSISKTIVLNKRPVANFSVTGAICGPSLLTINNTTTNSPTGWNWSATPAGATVLNGGNQVPSITFPVNTTNDSINYTVRLIASLAGIGATCIDTALRPFTVYPQPDVAFVSSQDTGCTVLNISFTNTSVARNNEPRNTMAFSWSINGNTASIDSVLAAQQFQNNTQHDSVIAVRLVGVSIHGCRDTANRTIRVYPEPKAEFTASTLTSCAPFVINGSVISLVQYPQANDTYSWRILSGNGASVLDSSTGTAIPLHTISSPRDSVIYQLIVTNIHGCRADTIDTLFRTIANPVAAFSMSDSIGCSALNITFTNLSPPGVTSSWLFSDGQTSAATDPSMSFVNASHTIDAVYFAKLIITAGSTGCRDSITDTIRVFPKPRSVFGITPTNICPFATVGLINTSAYKSSTALFHWEILNSDTVNLSNDTVFAPNLLIPDNQSNADSLFSVRLQIISVDGCIHDTTRSFTRLRRPKALFTVPVAGCGPLTFTPVNNTTNIPPSELSWLWAVTPNTSVSIVSSNSQTPAITLPVNTTPDSLIYNVKLTAIRNGSGCIDSASQSTVIYPKPAVDFTASLDTGCTPLNVTFANATNARNHESRATMNFVWGINGNTISSDSVLISQLFNNVSVNDSTIAIRLIGTTQHGCKDTADKSIIVFPEPRAEFTATDSTLCAPFLINSAVVFPVAYPQANDGYTWNILSGNRSTVLHTSSGITVPVDTITNPLDSVIYQLIATNVHGCRADTMEMKFRTIANPEAAFSMSDSLGCTALNVTFTNQSSIGVSLNWQFSNGQTSTALNPSVSFINTSNTADALYFAKLVITAGTGCRDSIADTIRVFPKPRSVFGVSQANICPLSSVGLSNASVFKGSSASFNWNILNSDTVKISNDTATTPNLLIPDNQSNADSTFNVSLRTISVDGCIHDTTGLFTRLRRPKVDFTIPLQSCGPFTFTPVNNTNNIPAPSLSWLWQVTPNTSVNIVSSNSQNPSVTLPVNTAMDSLLYAVKLTATRNGAGCIDSLVQHITIYPKPSVDFTLSNDTGCTPLAVSFTNTSTARNNEARSTMGFAWKINGNSASSDSVLVPQSFVNPSQHDSTLTVQLIGTTMHGCRDTLDRNMIVRPDAKAEYSFVRSVSCAPFVIDNTVIINVLYPQANSSYEWYVNDSLIGVNPVFPGYTLPHADDSVSIKLKTISISGCRNDSQTVVFKTIPNPKPDFNFIDSIGCTPFVFGVTNTSTPPSGLTYEWLAGTQVSTLQHPVFNAANFGVIDTLVRVKLVVIAGGTGCRDSIEKTAIVKPLPNPDLIIVAATHCFPQPILVQNNSTAPPALKNDGYKWFVNGPGVASIFNDTASVQAEINVPDNQSGTSRNYSIKLIATSAFGCIDSISKTVNVPTRPVADFTFSKDSSCSYETIFTGNGSLYANQYSWAGLSAGLNITAPAGTTTAITMPVHQGNADSLYYLKLVAVNSAGCADSITKSFVVLPKPIASYSVDSNMGCGPLPVQFGNLTDAMQPVSYLWLLESNVTDTHANVSHTFSGSVQHDTLYQVVMIATGAGGCLDTTTQPITVKSGAAARVSTTNPIYCMNTLNEGIVPVFNLSFGDADSFYYDFGDTTTLITTEDTNVVHTYHYEGTYLIKLTAKNSCRISHDSVTVKILKAPVPVYTLTDTLGCSPLVVKFKNNTINYEANYTWDFGNGSSSVLKDPDSMIYYQSKFTDTTYIVKLTAGNFCGISSLQDTVRVLPIPIASFVTTTDSGCSPLPVGFINTTTGLPSFVKWYFGNGDSSVRYHPYAQVYRTEDSATIYQVKLIVSNMCGIDSAFKSITVQPNSVRAGFTTTGVDGCAPFKVAFFDKSVGGTKLSWDLGGGNTSTLPNPEVTYTIPGFYTAKQFVNNGCSYDTASVVVNIRKKPEFTIAKSATTACVGQAISFTATLKDSGAMLWEFGDGTTSTLVNPVHAYTSGGVKIIKVTVQSHLNGCPTILVDSVTINPLPVVEISADTNQGCDYKTFVFTTGASTGLFYNWAMGDGNVYTGLSVSHTYGVPSTYTVKLVAETASGCKDSATKLITIFPKPAAAFSYTPEDTCTGPVEVRFTNESTGANSYLWIFGGGLNTSITNPSITYDTVGSYDISLIAGNQYNCFDTAIAVYHVYHVPLPSFTFTPENGCEPLTVNFTNTSIYGDSLFWDFGDGASSVSLNPVHTYISVGTFDVKLTVVEGGICAADITETEAVVVYPKPVAEFTGVLDSSIRPYSVVRFTNFSTGATQYAWRFSDGGSSTETNPGHRFSTPQYYTAELIAISERGCMDSIGYEVWVPEYNKGLYVPNAFTPGYGQPEVQVFKPAGIELQSYHLKIYNKWGELIWETTALTAKGEPEQGWNGLDKQGRECVQGAYVWAIQAVFTNGKQWEGMIYPTGNKRPVTSGNVTLIR